MANKAKMANKTKTSKAKTSKTQDKIISVKNLTVRRGKQAILQDVSFSLGQGEIISIIGPNGGGKTTLSRVLVDIIKPSEGKVWRAPDLQIGYVPQYVEVDYLMPFTTEFFLKISPHYSKERTAELAKDFGLTELLGKQFSHLSGGQKQRVLLARAVMGSPQLLVLDEPTQSLDMEGSSKFYEILAPYAAKNNCAVILVSHDLNFVMSSTNYVFCLNRHICCKGHPQEVGKDPAFVNLFGKQMAKNLAIYSHYHNHSHS